MRSLWMGESGVRNPPALHRRSRNTWSAGPGLTALSVRAVKGRRTTQRPDEAECEGSALSPSSHPAGISDSSSDPDLDMPRNLVLCPPTFARSHGGSRCSWNSRLQVEFAKNPLRLEPWWVTKMSLILGRCRHLRTRCDCGCCLDCGLMGRRRPRSWGVPSGNPGVR